MDKHTEFPIWKGYEDMEKMKQLISCGCYNDPKQILEYAAKMSMERIYFKDLLLFLQYRIQRHIEAGEGLGIGMDSSKEIFDGLMLVSAEDVAFPENDNIDDNIDENEDENGDINEDIYERFVKDMEDAGIEYEEYHGRFFYHGPAVMTNEKGFPTLQDVIRATKIVLQWDNMGKTDFVCYPIIRGRIKNGYKEEKTRS